MSATKRSGLSLQALLPLCAALYLAGRLFRDVDILPDSRNTHSSLQEPNSRQPLGAHSSQKNANIVPAEKKFTDATRHPPPSSEDESDADTADDLEADASSEDDDVSDQNDDASDEDEDSEDDSPDESAETLAKGPKYARAGLNDTLEYIFPFRVDDPTFPGPPQFQELLNKLHLQQDRPPVRHGASGTGAYSAMPFQVLSWHPRILLLPNFVELKICRQLLKLGQQLANQQGTRGKNTDGLPLTVYGNPDSLVSYIQSRMASFTRIPYAYAEWARMFQYGGYGRGYTPNWQTEKRYMASIVVYLTDVQKGGEDVFPYEGEDGLSRSLGGADPCKNASIGYRVSPRMGDALIVWRQAYNGEMDDRAVAYTCPVKKGVKWVVVMRFFEAMPGDLNMERRTVNDVW